MLPSRRMIRLGMKMVDLCAEMERRGRTSAYMSIAMVYHGNYNDRAVTEEVCKTLDELEAERGLSNGSEDLWDRKETRTQ